ncbi:MAG: bifunctional sugar-1-phosphate nucleotidylyltransferase/acetyltransferase [Microgenomates group bacterium]
MKKIPLVILAAGSGTRLRPLTTTIPKPLIQFLGKPVMQHSMEAALPYVSEFICIVGVHEEKIRAFFGDAFHGTPITYIVQTEQSGTGHALSLAASAISDDTFMSMYGDDVYPADFFEKVAQHDGYAIVGQKKENWKSFGVLRAGTDGNLTEIVEKPSEFISDLVNPGLYKLGTDIFSLYSSVSLSTRGEYELTDLVSLFIKEHPVKVLEFKKGWYPLSYPWSLLDVVQELTSEMKPYNKGTIEEGVIIRGTVVIGEGTVIKSGAYIEGNFYIGKNCIIGPNCYLKGFGSIGDECVIGNAVEVCRSVMGNGVNIRHLSYVGDSVIGNSVNLAAGTILASLRHDGKNVRVTVNGIRVDSGRQKLGAIIGDNVKTGIHTSIMPGCKLEAGRVTLPAEVVREDKP